VETHPNIREYQGVIPKLGQRVYVDPAAVIIGDVVVGDDTSIWPGAVIRGDVNTIRIGRRTSVQDSAVLHVTRSSHQTPRGWPLRIGDDVTIGHNACLHGCTVGDRVLIGIGATVLDGGVIPDEVMIGAGALVPPHKQLQSGYLYIGSPAKALRPLTDEERPKFKSYKIESRVTNPPCFVQ
jgi:carbonic anhydrase/acetyltransferase-like protein (isoleucine patch superfamily)